MFLFLASQCVNVSCTKVGKIEISGNKKDVALEKLSCAAICNISFAERTPVIVKITGVLYLYKVT